jgi:methylmalonyl-CoA mutase C-terminal domain/subunit
MTLFPRILDGLKAAGLKWVLVTAGGIIPEDDVERLRALGMGRIFGPGSPLSEIIDYIKAEVSARRSGT